MKVAIHRDIAIGLMFVWPTDDTGLLNHSASLSIDSLLREAGLAHGYRFPASRLTEAIAVLRLNGYTDIEVQE